VTAAQQNAPFLFALLFILIITTASHVSYSKICARKNPPASKEEKGLYELYFKANIWFGMVLVLASVGWWVYAWRLNRDDQQAADANVAMIKQLKEHVTYQYHFSVVNPHRDIAQVSAHFPRITTTTEPNVQIDFFVIESPDPFRTDTTFDVQITMPDRAYLACLANRAGPAPCPAAQTVTRIAHVPYKDGSGSAMVFALNIDTGTLDPTTDITQLERDWIDVAAARSGEQRGDT
jgi:hypothetical protein